ncbi:hypothetical protein NEHOM01_1772 [Nematocida homosporus]|uniref:uncharacterized protein n=1 Tax=Nematocida homosporus TaxID=1912981 RepID=UPI00221E8097|nr:uncharacterized protein NEHOM01_1772 [Nematocida homosporus]KAI5186883.1 hypothetical protein NEHOM01_1772 [Nematocida homosporus]
MASAPAAPTAPFVAVVLNSTENVSELEIIEAINHAKSDVKHFFNLITSRDLIICLALICGFLLALSLGLFFRLRYKKQIIVKLQEELTEAKKAETNAAEANSSPHTIIDSMPAITSDQKSRKSETHLSPSVINGQLYSIDSENASNTISRVPSNNSQDSGFGSALSRRTHPVGDLRSVGTRLTTRSDTDKGKQQSHQKTRPPAIPLPTTPNVEAMLISKVQAYVDQHPEVLSEVEPQLKSLEELQEAIFQIEDGRKVVLEQVTDGVENLTNKLMSSLASFKSNAIANKEKYQIQAEQVTAAYQQSLAETISILSPATSKQVSSASPEVNNSAGQPNKDKPDSPAPTALNTAAETTVAETTATSSALSN